MTARSVARPRRTGHARNRRLIRRRSAGVRLIRAAATIVMVAVATAVYVLATGSEFHVRAVSVSGTALSAEADVLAAAGIAPDANPFTIESGDVARRVEALPTVASARVDIDLVAGASIRVTERTPILAWAIGDRRLFVDESGTVFAVVPAEPADPRVGGVLAGLPLVHDERPSSTSLAVGSSLDPTEFDVARRLGALRPADVGSGASGLEVSIEAEGFVVRPSGASWSAVFGLYTPTLRPPSVVPGQVRLLASLLARREASVGRVHLASETDGTYEPRSSLRSPSGASASPSP
jgi:hypothetical protein